MKRQHEGLQNYLKSLRGPGEVASLTPNPRQPVGPDAPLPIGLRPIPTSSQRPKPTNATIVYARTAITDSHDLGRSGAPPQTGSRPTFGAPPIALSMAEGDVVFTHRMTPATRAPLGQNVKVISLRMLNEDLRRMGPMNSEEAGEAFIDNDLHFKWCPDGVVNNLDGADPTNEFKDFAIANVALQGFVRFSTLPFGDEAVGHNFPSIFTTQKGVRNGDRVYLVFSRSAEPVKRPNPVPDGYQDRYTYQFRLLLASHITTGKFLPTDETVGETWCLGRVVDGNQSKNMVTLCVGIEPMWEDEEGGYGLSPADILCLKWMDGRSDEQRERLREIRGRVENRVRELELLRELRGQVEGQVRDSGSLMPLPKSSSSWSYKQWFRRDLIGNFDGAPYTSALG